tara:strand:- start:212 stop:568 length:357 start_codon:yes stop_codon:yes gene_type:complete
MDNKKKSKKEKFFEAWNSSKSVKEVAKKLDRTTRAVRGTVRAYRHLGYKLNPIEDDEIYEDIFEPTQEQIAEQTAIIRDSWSENVEQQRLRIDWRIEAADFYYADFGIIRKKPPKSED